MRRFAFPAGSLRRRFALGMGLTLIPLLLVAVSATVALERSLAAIHDVVEEASEEVAVVLRLQVLLERANASIQGCLSRAAFRQPCDGFANSRKVLDAAFRGAADAPFALPEERELVQSAREHWDRAGDLGETVLAVANARRTLAWELESLHAHISRAVDALDRAHSLSEWEMAASLATVHGARRRATFLILAVLALGTAITLTGARMLARSILAPVNEIKQGAERLSAGDFAYRVAVASCGELARLGTTFNAMAEKLASNRAALVELAVRDGLTGIYNHREFQRHLGVELEESRRSGDPLAMLLMDVDRFKSVNDTQGHQAGDAVLRGVTARLSQAARPTDLVARYGGDEFVILLPRTSRSGAMAMAERIRGLVATPAAAGETRTPDVTVSIGIAVCPDHAQSKDDLIREADDALYAAKHAGGNQTRAAG